MMGGFPLIRIPIAINMIGIPWLTRDLPYVSENDIAHLELKGLPKIGSNLDVGDILVGLVRAVRPINSVEKEIADLSLHHAGFDDLWINGSFYADESTAGTVQAVLVRNLIGLQETHPLRYLQYCAQFPQETILQEVVLQIK